MKYPVILFLVFAATASGQMEKRDRELYDLAEFRKRAPAVGKNITDLILRDLNGKKVSLKSLRSKPLVIIGGAYT